MTLRTVSRRTAVVIVVIAAIAIVAGVVVFWSRGDSGSTGAFCTALRSGENPLALFDRYDPSNADTTQLRRGVDRLQQLERAAPGEIEQDMKVLVDVARELVTALDPASKDKTVPDIAGQFDRVRRASAAVTRFTSQQCGMTLDSGSSPPVSEPVPEPASGG